MAKWSTWAYADVDGEDAGASFDMQAHFEDTRAWFFGVFLGLGVLDVTDTLFKRAAGVTRLEGRYLVEYAAFLGVWLVGAAYSLGCEMGGFWVPLECSTSYSLSIFHAIGSPGPTLGGRLTPETITASTSQSVAARS